ncbi:MAG TPA: hypothetical protein VGM14_15125 [Streptosporangiaceae bacterium]|jgi:hypothetical protein
MTKNRGTDELTAFLAQRGDHLMRSAALMAGGRQAGEDLLQAAVERLLARWRRFDGDPERYLRRTIVDYGRKEWARGPGGFDLTTPTLSCHRDNLFLPQSPTALTSWIRGVHKLIKCGDLVVSGTAQVNGIQTIKLKTATSFAVSAGDMYSTLWVKRSDYAPVRMVTKFSNVTTRSDVSWLPPTKANVALLRVPIPPGFHRVKFSRLAGTSSESCSVSSSHPHKQTCTHSG